MKGFKLVQTNEHEFARFLRKHKAINGWRSLGHTNYWYGPDGRDVAACTYTPGTLENSYWIRKDLDF